MNLTFSVPGILEKLMILWTLNIYLFLILYIYYNVLLLSMFKKTVISIILLLFIIYVKIYMQF